MRIKYLELINFRNFKNIVLSPCDSINVICGENAQGKTNILEAIWLFTGTKSFRNVKDNDFINFDSNNALCKIKFTGEGIEKDAELKISEKREASLNNKKLKSVSFLAGNFNAIVFSPNDLGIVTNGPAVRRKFLDIAIGQLYPSYIQILKNYIRAITQRNKIIKELKYDSTLNILLDVFENEIAIEGKKIITLRKKYIDTLNNFLPDIYSKISGGREILETTYLSLHEADFKEKLKIMRKEDMFSGVTSIGPHRDDIEFKINKKNAKSFASQGQKRSIVLALKLAEAEVLKKKNGERPICLLDDVMSELDPERQNFILNHINGMQTFLTCCDPDNIKNLDAGKLFTIREGKIF